MTPHAIDLRFDGAVVRAEADEAGDLDWLARALACGFEPVADATPQATVRLVIDAGRFADLLARGAAAGGERTGFAQDADPYPLTGWRGADASELLHDAQVPAFHAVDRPHRTVTIIAAARTFASRLALLRVVRELAMDRVVAGGGVLVHGAALATDDGVVVITAPKGHGKTTLLLSLLTQAPVAYVSNDRCVLRIAADGTATVRGLPTIVAITRDGLTRFPAVRDRLFAARPDLAGDRPKIGLTPDELVRILALPCTAAGPAAAFLFPRITANPARLTLTRLETADALAPLRAGLFRAGHTTLLGEVFAWKTPPGLTPWQAGARALRHVAAHVPCFAAELGGAAPPDAAECRVLLDTIAAVRR